MEIKLDEIAPDTPVIIDLGAQGKEKVLVVKRDNQGIWTAYSGSLGTADSAKVISWGELLELHPYISNEMLVLSD